MPTGTPEEELFARLAVHDHMLVEIWLHTCGDDADALGWVDDAAAAALRRLDESFETIRKGGTTVQALAAERMAALWSLIRASVAELDEPTDLIATPYGLRLAEKLRREGKLPPEAPLPPDVGEAPDR